MTLRYLTLGGATAIALSALSLSAISATPAVPATQTAPAPARQTVPLNKVTNASTTLLKMRVENAKGESLGTVADVVTQSDGKAIAVTIDFGAYLGLDHRLVGVQADKLGFDQGRRVLVANLTKAEIKAMPSFS